jgi:hypothetical protein
MNAAPAQQVAAWASLAEEQQLEALQKAASGRLAQMLQPAAGVGGRKGGKRRSRGGSRRGGGSGSDEDEGLAAGEPGQRALLGALTAMQAGGS